MFDSLRFAQYHDRRLTKSGIHTSVKRRIMLRRKHWIAASTAVALGIALWLAQDSAKPATVARLTAENFKQFAPEGKEVDAIAGDIVLQNEFLTAVIAQPVATRHANMTVREVAGCLIDFATRDRPSDQLGAFFPGQRQIAFREWKVFGARMAPIDLQAKESAESGSVGVVLTAPGSEEKPGVTVTYQLEGDEPFLTVTTKFTNSGSKPLVVPLIDDLRIDAGKELMVKSANGEGTLFWAHDRYWNQAYAISAAGSTMEMNSDARTTTIKHRSNGDNKVTLMPGGDYQFTRWLFVGRDLLEARALAALMRGDDVPTVQIRVVGDDRSIPDAEITFRRGEVLYGSGRTDKDGVLTTAMPAGDYLVSVDALGVELTRDFKYRQETTSGSFQEIRLANYSDGKVVAKIVDQQGQPIPCKIEFKAQAGTPQPDFGPATGSFGVKNLKYAPLGSFEQSLPAGTYDVTISHGPEFDAIFTTLKVPPKETVALDAQLVRAVDTRGWVSSDFHSHSSPSGDNTSSQVGRVLNHVCENLEFVPCTEHNRIDTYDAIIAELGVKPFVSTVSGIELTNVPLPLNHQNAFPMVRHPFTQDNGAPLPDAEPETQIERLALWDQRSEKLVQINHPDMGWMFYDKNGDGQPDAGYERMKPHVTALEVHPIDAILERTPRIVRSKTEINNTIFAWLQTLNQGFRVTGVVNSDAHDNFHGTGWLRNWIQSSTDDPAQIQPLELVRASNQGRLIMSNGPFLEVKLNEAGQTNSITAGQDLAVSSGKVQLDVRVQTPNWFDIDHVFVLVNGKPAESLDFTREKHPERFTKEGVVKFQQKLELTLTEDAHIIVVAAGEKSTLSKVYGLDWAGNVRPVAVSNPMYLDVNSGGFTPNKDTLGHPLPKKAEAKKL